MKGNQIKSNEVQWNIENFHKEYNEIKEFFTKEFLKIRKNMDQN